MYSLFPDFVVHMRAGTRPCGAGQGDLLSPPNALPHLHIERSVVGVDRGEAVPVLENNAVAGIVAPISEAHYAVGGRPDRCSRGRSYVDAGVKRLFPGNRVYPWPERGAPTSYS